MANYGCCATLQLSDHTMLATNYSYTSKDIVYLLNQICNDINTIHRNSHSRNRGRIPEQWMCTFTLSTIPINASPNYPSYHQIVPQNIG